MRKFDRTRGIAIVTLLIGLVFAIGSGWIEGVSFSNPEGSFVRWCGGVADKLFTLSVVFILIFGFQVQRTKTLARLHRLEDELSALKANVTF